MRPYVLLTPGPLTTTDSVKQTMMADWCTWDEDYNVHIVEEIRKDLVALATPDTDEYTSILMQGSGTYCVEAVIGSAIKPGISCSEISISLRPNSAKPISATL